jgi:hypothetical protein
MLATQVRNNAEFASSLDPLAMLGYLADKASTRKLQLFCLAILRRQSRICAVELIEYALSVATLATETSEPRSPCLEALILIEEWGRNLPATPELFQIKLFLELLNFHLHLLSMSHASWGSWYEAAWGLAIRSSRALAASSPGIFARWMVNDNQILNNCLSDNYGDFDFSGYEENPAPVANIMRDIFSLAPTIHPHIRLSSNLLHIPSVLTTAQCLANAETLVDLPILADALEEAGCDNAAILQHCRQESEHVRGCWVLDLLLGKT